MDVTVTDPLVGRVLDRRYRVGARLARGGMATVYEAHDSRLDRIVALKVMHQSLAEDEDFVSRFIREAHSAARLSHPNVVAVFDQGADDGHVFLAMELVRGHTLRDLIRNRGGLPPRTALEVFEAILAALGAAHQAGLIHRDVKPENVLLSDDGRIKVADFGLARAVTGASSHTTANGIVMGTVAYLSPEQVERGAADPRSDVYAAGIVLYEMLTGVKPYDGDTAIQVAYRHVNDDVPRPSALVPGLPAELDRLVARATSRNPDGRPSDARRMLTETVAVRRTLVEREPGEPPQVNGGLSALAAPTSGPRAGRPGRSEPTLVVQLDEPRPLAPARRGDTGPLGGAAGAPQQTRPRRRHRGWVAFLVLLLLAGALSAGAWAVAMGPLSKTTTPSLLKLSPKQAQQRAATFGLSTEVTGSDYSEVVPKGRVLDTEPDRGESIDKDGTIGLILSKGPERYAVPELENRTEGAARRALDETKLTVGDPVLRWSSTVPEGSVISSAPPAGQLLRPGAVVTLVVSKGVEPVAVPDVVGQDQEDALAAIKEAELKAAVEEKFDEEVPAGQVVSQSPQNGTAPKKSVVQLVVSKGPPLVDVPDVLTRSVGDATAILQQAGFVVRAYGPGFGNVFSQQPRGGQAPRGSTITLFYI